VDVETASAAQDLAIIALLTGAVDGAGTQDVGPAQVQPRLLEQQFVAVDFPADGWLSFCLSTGNDFLFGFVPGCYDEIVLELVATALDFGGDGLLATGVFADLRADHDGALVLEFDAPGRFAEVSQLVPAGLHRARSAYSVTLTRPVHQPLNNLGTDSVIMATDSAAQQQIDVSV